jgi:hypothetical protein
MHTACSYADRVCCAAERVLGTVLGGTLGYAVYEIGRKFWDRT